VCGSLDLCIGFLLVTPALAAFFLHAHAHALAILGTLNLVPHMCNLFIDAWRDALDASGFGERHACAMLREMCRAPRGPLQTAAGYHHGDRAFLD
jgi:hypothetical protein